MGISDKVIKAFGTDAIASYGIKVSGTLVVYATHILLARMLGQSEFGLFATILVFTAVVAQLATLGFNESTKRFLPNYLALGKVKIAKVFISYSSNLTLISAITSSILLGGIFGLAQISGVYPDIPIAIYLGLIAIPVLCWTHLIESVAIARSFLVRGLAPTYIGRPLITIIIVALAIYFVDRPDAIHATIALIIACVLSGIPQSIMIAKALKSEFDEVEEKHPDESIPPRIWWVKQSLPLFVAQGFFTLAINIDVLVIGLFLDNTSVAIYFAAVKTVSLLAFIHQSIGSVAARRLSESHAKLQHATFQNFFRLSALAATILTVLGAGFLMLAGPFILGLFGEGFEAGIPLMTILLVGIIGQAFTCSSQEALLVHGHQKAIATIQSVSFFINIIANIILVQMYGLMGVAIATAVVTLLRALATYRYAAQQTGIRLITRKA